MVSLLRFCACFLYCILLTRLAPCLLHVNGHGCGYALQKRGSVFEFVSQGGVTAINNSYGTAWLACLKCGLIYLLLYYLQLFCIRPPLYTRWDVEVTSDTLHAVFTSNKTCPFLCIHKVFLATEHYSMKPTGFIEVKLHVLLTSVLTR